MLSLSPDPYQPRIAQPNQTQIPFWYEMCPPIRVTLTVKKSAVAFGLMAKGFHNFHKYLELELVFHFSILFIIMYSIPSIQYILIFN